MIPEPPVKLHAGRDAARDQVEHAQVGRAALGQAAVGASRTAPFLGERYSRGKAQVAVARSILVIIWRLLGNPEARFTDLGYGYYQARTDTDHKLRNHIRQIQALGFEVTLAKTP
jgi:transposase